MSAVAPYRNELEAAQRRIDSLEAEVEEKAEQVEELRDAVESRDRHLQELQEKFDGAPPRQWRGRLLRHAIVAVAVVIVGAVFIIQFRPGMAEPLSEGSDAGAAAPDSTLTFADPPPGGAKGAERAEAETSNPGSFDDRAEAETSRPGSFDEAAQRRALEARVWSGVATEAEIRMLRAICSHQGDIPCRDRATQMLRVRRKTGRTNEPPAQQEEQQSEDGVLVRDRSVD